MASPLKELYSPQFYSGFSSVLEEVIPSFNEEKFRQLIFDKHWAGKELKERMKHTSIVLHEFMPGDFESAAATLVKIIEELRQRGVKESSLEFMFLPDYIENYGIEHFDTSVKTIEFVTQFTSCEFAVRPFIIKYGDRMIRRMQAWSMHENLHVRRLATEGCRPRLPWAIALPELKKDPGPILPILEKLKKDPAEYVRRSVANNLNDIAKDHPNFVLSIARQWKGNGKETDAIIKHGCRTLLKQGHPEILNYFGLSSSKKLRLSGFNISTPKLKIGEHLVFSFRLKNAESKTQTVRLEYGVYYLRQNGQHSKKVFKISERQLQPNETTEIQRKQSFRIITTKRFYTGQQKLSIIVNGLEREIGNFELIE